VCSRAGLDQAGLFFLGAGDTFLGGGRLRAAAFLLAARGGDLQGGGLLPPLPPGGGEHGLGLPPPPPPPPGLGDIIMFPTQVLYPLSRKALEQQEALVA
jgi:hypothetical protein